MDDSRAKVACGKFMLLVGLVKMGDEYVNGAEGTVDLAAIKERVMHKVLNINNYIKSLCDYYNREMDSAAGLSYFTSEEPSQAVRHTATNLERFVSRNEFFVYSVSVTFNPRIATPADLLKESGEGDGVCTITVKLPKEKQRQAFYIRLMLKLISKNSLMLRLTPEAPAASARAPRQPDPAPSSTPERRPAEAAPGYFDDDAKGGATGSQYVRAGMNSFSSYSFFNQSSMILSKYVNSNVVLREDDRLMAERLMREKEKKRRELQAQGLK
ncbi:DUF2339 domain-containing protein [Babesia caballi]|uniref:DUF2339 domain-containing protein n=1 Tax=Babesia caballi TaxID=5871 RepID=A0AAV4M0N2_BABCB|nr:DUF2339 domain-containing protein [Babesia caballi]